MIYVNLNEINSDHTDYEPIHIIDNYLYLARKGFSEYEKIYGANYEYSQIVRYNIDDGQMEAVNISNKVNKLFFSKHNKNLSYVIIEDGTKNYNAHFYQINTEMNSEKKIFSLEIQKCFRDYPWNVSGRFKPIVLNCRFILYLIDVVGFPEEGWIHTENSNKYELYLYDILEGKRYPVKDEKLYFHGFNKSEIINVDDIDYLVINAAEYDDCDRYDESFMSENPCNIEYRGRKEAIYIVPVDVLIEETIEGKERISFKEIESVGEEGSIHLENISDSKIYYKVIRYNKGQELVVYDIITGKYERTQYNPLFLRYITSNLVAVSVDAEMHVHLQELQGDNRIIDTSMDIIDDFRGFLESRYLIYKQFEMSGTESRSFVNIYDIHTSCIVKKVEGDAKVFPEKNLVVIYQVSSLK